MESLLEKPASEATNTVFQTETLFRKASWVPRGRQKLLYTHRHTHPLTHLLIPFPALPCKFTHIHGENTLISPHCVHIHLHYSFLSV